MSKVTIEIKCNRLFFHFYKTF